MQVFGYPMDLRSQTNRKRLRFWVAILLTFYALILANRVDHDDDDTQDTELTAH